MSVQRLYATIDLNAIQQNIQEMIRCTANDARICCVVKADGYGHGSLQVARCVESEERIWGFAAATTEEAMLLRTNGIRKPIMILGYVFPDDYETLIIHQVRIPVFSAEMAKDVSNAALRTGKTAKIHLIVDTGMNRIGFTDSKESADEIETLLSYPNLEAEGIFTHFARADEKDKSHAFAALERFLAFVRMLEERGIHIPLCHSANSAATMEFPASHLNMVRVGISMYGIYPSDEMDKEACHLVPAMELKSRVSFVKTVPAGEPVSYGGTYVTEREMRIATVPAGYADGYPRSLSNKGCVLIGGKRARILGRICMDQMMVDVTGLPCEIGAEVTLMGRDGDEFLGINELSDLSGRFPYEFICVIGKRVPRVYPET
ncbi:MAG: alanine racemase [Lachnospiraceae bacterium]|nr:alanine racemase [Lachnospiraceae bacterium]